MNSLPKNDNAPVQGREVGKAKFSAGNPTPPKPTGQCLQVLNLIRQRQPILLLVLTADMAIPEAAARIHDLRCMGFNILTAIRPVVIFRGVERRNVAAYSIGAPEWPAPGYFDTTADGVQLDLDLGAEVVA